MWKKTKKQKKNTKTERTLPSARKKLMKLPLRNELLLSELIKKKIRSQLHRSLDDLWPTVVLFRAFAVKKKIIIYKI